MAVANYQIRINGGTPIDVGNVLTYDATGLTGGTSYDFEVRAEDAAGNFSAWGTLASFSTLTPLFDSLPTTNAVVLSLYKERSAYGGPAIRVALSTNSAVQLDIGFDSDGYADQAAYDAFDTNAHVITRYDQSGNGHHASIPFANVVKMRISTLTKKPCLYGGQVNLGSISGLTILNGVADYNIIQVERMITTAGGTAWSCGADERSAYLGAGSEQFNDNGSSARTLFVDEYCLSKAAKLWRWQYDGGGATNALKARVYTDEREMTASGGSGLGSTSHTESTAGIYLNSTSGSTGGRDVEVFATYILPYDVTDPDWSFIIDSTRSTWFGDINPRLIGYGTSLTVGYPYNGTTNAPIEKLAAALTTRTGRTWSVLNLAETATQLDRILEVQQNEGRYDLDHWREWDIRIGDGGTNDLGGGVSVADTNTRLDALFAEFRAQGINATTPVFYRNIILRKDEYEMTIDSPTFASRSTSVNSHAVTAASPDIYIVDARSDTRLGNPDDTTVFVDQVHCSVLGYSYMEDDFLTALIAALGV